MNTLLKHRLIPVMTSINGLCLTPQNLMATQTTHVALELDKLLMKPGFDALMQSSFNLKKYIGWPLQMVLDASMLKFDQAQKVMVQSIYDGQKLSYTMAQIFDLIRKLCLDDALDDSQPQEAMDGIEKDVILIPQNCAASFSAHVVELTKKTHVFWFFDDALRGRDGETPANIYLTKATLKEGLNVQHLRDNGMTLVVGNFNLEQSLDLFAKGVHWILSDQLTADGANGKVYSQKGLLDLKESQYVLQFEPIDKACQCETCAQGFTRAYLYHLYRNTPLLCQRLLIQHNLYSAQSAI